jgi:CubicO group peptidase (beta-lactamase class C family)
VARFLDPFFARQMRAAHITGLVFVLVKGDAVLFAKGYGHADAAGKVSVCPETTVFPVGSVTKAVTATAVLRLVEQGRLDLHRDVNDYLRHFRVPDRFPEPVTLAHLLTHTAGFDEQNIGTYARAAADAPPLAERVARRLPPRLRPPGRAYGYANYNIDLAGYLAESVAGVPFPRLVEEEILRPLAMRSSGLGEPPPGAGSRAQGHVQRWQGRRPAPPTFDATPSSGLLTTGHDMGRFLRAHLQGGRCGPARVLQEETLRLMHARQFAPDPRVEGIAYGFGEYLANGERALTQSGTFPGFVSLLFLLPERGVGFFVAYNNCHPFRHLNADLIDAFLDRYYPAGPAAEASAGPAAGASLARFAGTYRSLRHSRCTPEKLVTLLHGQVTVREAGDGTLLIGAERWRQQGPLLFTGGGGRPAAFEEDAHGAVAALHLPQGTYERIPWYETLTWHLVALPACAAVFASACLVGLVNAAARLVRRPAAPPPLLLRALRAAAAGLAALNLYYLARLVVVVLTSDLYDFVYGMSAPLQGLLDLFPVLAAGAAVLTALLGAAWWYGVGSRRARVFYSVVAGASLGLLVVYYNLNLFGRYS